MQSVVKRYSNRLKGDLSKVYMKLQLLIRTVRAVGKPMRAVDYFFFGGQGTEGDRRLYYGMYAAIMATLLYVFVAL